MSSRSLRLELAYTLTVTGVLGGMLAFDGFAVEHNAVQGWIDIALAGVCLLIAEVLMVIETWKQLR